MEQKIKKIIGEYVGVDPEEIETSDNLREDLLMSATDLADITHRLEEEGMPSDNLDFTEIKTVEDLIERLASEIEL